jgi:aryl-alcohol dehydrogenase-like predicted oxidoreductase
MTLPEMALRFVLADPDVSTIIVGMRKLQHVRENMKTSDAGPLDPALIAKLREHRWDRMPTKWSD